jgi:hypothetical protein
MPSPPTEVWKNTPNKKDHYTQGYTNKIIFNYQVTGTTLEIGTDVDIIGEIISSGVNFKGSNELNSPYFQNADGRCFRISMYYLKPNDGIDVSLQQQLYDVDNETTYTFNLDNPGPIDSGGGEALVKYECYLSVFYDNGDTAYYAQANGSVIYSAKNNADVRMLQMSAYTTLTNGYTPKYKIRIINNSEGDIYPVSLMIEEIS